MEWLLRKRSGLLLQYFTIGDLCIGLLLLRAKIMILWCEDTLYIDFIYTILINNTRYVNFPTTFLNFLFKKFKLLKWQFDKLTGPQLDRFFFILIRKMQKREWMEVEVKTASRFESDPSEKLALFVSLYWTRCKQTPTDAQPPKCQWTLITHESQLTKNKSVLRVFWSYYILCHVFYWTLN